MKSRILSCFLIIALCVSLLSACDSTAGQSTIEPNNPAYSESASHEGDNSEQQPSSSNTEEPSQEQNSTPA